MTVWWIRAFGAGFLAFGAAQATAHDWLNSAWTGGYVIMVIVMTAYHRPDREEERYLRNYVHELEARLRRHEEVPR